MTSVLLGFSSLAFMFVPYRFLSIEPKRRLKADGIMFLIVSHVTTVLLLMLLVFENPLLIFPFIIAYVISYRIAIRTPFRDMLKKETRPAGFIHLLVFWAGAICFAFITCGIQNV